MNTILCEKKKEAIDNKINYQAYVEPGIPLDFIQDIDIIIIMGNIIDNAIEATKKLIMDTLILMYSQHKRDIS